MIKGWTTWDNRIIPAEKLSHQHLSNIYYYTHYILPEAYCQSIRDDVQELLDKRFNGKRLPFKPDLKFEFEQRRLRSKGWLRPNGDIVVFEFPNKHIKLN